MCGVCTTNSIDTVVQPEYGNALAGIAFQGNMDLIVG